MEQVLLLLSFINGDHWCTPAQYDKIVSSQTYKTQLFHMHICNRIWKKSFPHTSNLLTLTIYNFRLVNNTSLKFGQQEVPTWMGSRKKFQSVDNQVLIFQVYRIGCVWKTPFCKSGGGSQVEIKLHHVNI